MAETTRTTFDVGAYFRAERSAHEEVVRRIDEALERRFVDLVEEVVARLRDGGKILLFGNGGSAADCQHIATELAVRYTVDRPALAAIALTTDTSNLTAAGNDLGFERIFERQIEALGRPGDVAIGITTSGTSPNVVRGLAAARRSGLVTVAFTGRDGGRLPGAVDHCLVVPAETTARIQEVHLLLGHMLSGAVERAIGLVQG
jgi:D-sedoheptulose 7-phosphate isomerase